MMGTNTFGYCAPKVPELMSSVCFLKDISLQNTDLQFGKEAASELNKTIQGIATPIASIDTRQVEDLTTECEMPLIHITDEYRIDAKPFINRPFFVSEVKWTTQIGRYRLLPSNINVVPRDILISNDTLLNGLKMGSMYRYKASLSLSVAGTITHAGCILAAVIPPIPGILDASRHQAELVNTMLTGPHAFLHANEATSVMIDLPWYCNTDLDSLDMQVPQTTSPVYLNPISLGRYTGNFGTLVLMVLNPLQPSTGSSTTLSIVIECVFHNLEILVPTPRYVTYTAQSLSVAGPSAKQFAKKVAGDAIDVLWDNYLTGLHNPNTVEISDVIYYTDRNRLNNVDSKQYLENLDPYANALRTVEEPVFNTSIDEMAIAHVIGKKQYLGTFSINKDDPVGKLVWARPISPYQGGLNAAFPLVSTDAAILNGNLELLHFYTRAWKGNIKITIQSVMNNKQQVKIRLLQMYNPSVSVLGGYPSYQTILQAPSHLKEFSAGGQTQEVILPYLSRNRLMYCARDSNVEALMHGMYYIYVAQPLANSADSPIDVFFNVYMSLEPDFTFYGYSTEFGFVSGPAHLRITNVETRDEEYIPQSLEVMNKPQKQQEDVPHKVHVSEDHRLIPLLDVRPIIRRLYPIFSRNVTIPSEGSVVDPVKLSDIAGFNNLYSSPAIAIAAMYYGMHAGLKIRLRVFPYNIQQISNIAVKIFYTPQEVFPYNFGSIVSLAATQPWDSQGYRQTKNFQFPLTNIEIPTTVDNQKVYEFTVPNVSIFKFLGSPTKLSSTAAVTGFSPAVSDLGFLSVTFSTADTQEIKAFYTVEASFSDETRLGFHTISPLIYRKLVDVNSLLDTAGMGSYENANLTPNPKTSKYLYFTRV